MGAKDGRPEPAADEEPDLEQAVGVGKAYGVEMLG
jgi:hypothetical protein